jgi:hypothetical protein
MTMASDYFQRLAARLSDVRPAQKLQPFVRDAVTPGIDAEGLDDPFEAAEMDAEAVDSSPAITAAPPTPNAPLTRDSSPLRPQPPLLFSESETPPSSPMPQVRLMPDIQPSVNLPQTPDSPPAQEFVAPVDDSAPTIIETTVMPAPVIAQPPEAVPPRSLSDEPTQTEVITQQVYEQASTEPYPTESTPTITERVIIEPREPQAAAPSKRVEAQQVQPEIAVLPLRPVEPPAAPTLTDAPDVPDIVIGRVTVQVVAEQPRRRQPAAAPVRRRRSEQPGPVLGKGGARSKLRFGLGQM